MIYICLSTQNEASTVGLVLWKVRQVLEEFRREYHLLIADDASSDETEEVLEPYQRALPTTVIRNDGPLGYAASLESLIREALRRSDRPRRDCLVTLPVDFSVSPSVLPELIKRIESGADVVVGEPTEQRVSPGMRLIRRSAPLLLKPGVSLKGFRDVMSGVYAFRLITLKSCIRSRSGPLLRTEGRCASAELVARAAAAARQIMVVPIEANSPSGVILRKERPWALAVGLLRAGRKLKIPPAQTPVRRAS
jgi:glycosyltransferase involved in cell wall biosynthesis